MKYELPDNCITGIKEIDAQHQQLVDIINELDSAIENKNPAISDILNKMQDYIQNHFSYEEQLLENSAYPKLNEHRICHQRFLKTLESFQKVSDKENNTMAEQILSFLKEWLFIHIKNTDMAYLPYINKS